jgi:hypothetical protein
MSLTAQLRNIIVKTKLVYLYCNVLFIKSYILLNLVLDCLILLYCVLFPVQAVGLRN